MWPGVALMQMINECKKWKGGKVGTRGGDKIVPGKLAEGGPLIRASLTCTRRDG